MVEFQIKKKTMKLYIFFNKQIIINNYHIILFITINK